MRGNTAAVNVLLAGMYAVLLLSVLVYLPLIAGIHFEREVIPAALTNSDVVPLVTNVLSALLKVVIVINIFIAVLRYRDRDGEGVRANMRRLKLSLIPYWIINFVWIVAASLTTAFMGGLVLGLALLLSSYLYLASTSCYSLAYLGVLYRNNRITGARCIVHAVLQLCFVLDIIDTLYLLRTYQGGDA
jgi:hypothetical protein